MRCAYACILDEKELTLSMCVANIKPKQNKTKKRRREIKRLRENLILRVQRENTMVARPEKKQQQQQNFGSSRPSNVMTTKHGVR